MRSRFLVKLFASFALLVVVNAFLVHVFVSRWASEAGRESITESLVCQAALLAEAFRPALTDGGGGESLARRVDELAAATGSRFTIVAADGRVLADSAGRTEEMENHLTRPEFVEAASKGRGTAERISKTTGQPTLYVCLAVHGGQPWVGFVRAALPVSGVDAQLDRLRNKVIAGVALGTLIALALAVFVARKVTRPLLAMTHAAAALAEGDDTRPIARESRDEIGDLARAFNRMSNRLRERLADVETERAKLATVLESMAEGVVAVDAEERLLHCNAAARMMLGLPRAGGIAAPLVELARVPELVESLRKVLGREHATRFVEELRVHGPAQERVLSIHAAPLVDGGAVAMLLDVTELRRLETVRRDFVANVSHEIKTPLAAMRGLVETLQDDDTMDPAVRSRFLGKLGDHVQRLADLATDLLHLARAESEKEAARVPVDLDGAAVAACERFLANATARSVTLEHVPADRTVVVAADPEAMVHILDNLIDNAIKYTPAGGRVTVRAGAEGADGWLEVIDTGIGIEPAEQKRVFERFYRVDKARSREVPGTGLGLSIVKHLIDAHGGAIELESWPGRGSTFRIRMPLGEGTASGGNGALALRAEPKQHAD